MSALLAEIIIMPSHVVKVKIAVMLLPAIFICYYSKYITFTIDWWACTSVSQGGRQVPCFYGKNEAKRNAKYQGLSLLISAFHSVLFTNLQLKHFHLPKMAKDADTVYSM
jgi:hypothetical protein